MRALILAVLLAACASVRATEDTDTPGPGRWEINLGFSASRTGAGWEYGAPDADINYGWGERIQLMLGASRIALHESGAPLQSGMGPATLGFKWRLLDQDRAGYALALFPKYAWNLSSSAQRRGLVTPGRSLLLPLLAGVRRGDTGYFAEVGRKFVEGEPHEWAGGVKVLNQCMARVECRLELQHSLVPPRGRQTLAGAGFKWALDDSFVLVAGIARNIGPDYKDSHSLVFNLGLQILR